MPKATLISPISKQGIQLIRVAAYCRVSSSSADQQNSYATQIDYYTKLAKKKKSEWNMVEIFADEGISGMKAKNRPEFQRMIRMCELHQIDLIVTKSVSRFARNVKEALEYVRNLKLLGVGVIFEKEGINTMSLGDEMLLNTFTAIAQEESKAISQNQRLSIVKRMELGVYVDSNAPYGFHLENKQLVEYPPEADIVRWIFQAYLRGMSTAEIAKDLSDRGVPTKNGKEKWKSSKISYMLSNERYIGDCCYQKTYRGTTVPFKQSKNRGEEDMYYATGTHAPIVEKDLFEKVQVLLKKEKNNSPKPRHKISTLFRAAFDVPNAALSIAGKFAAEVSNGSVPGTKKTSRLVTRTTTAKNEGEAPMWLVENSHPAIVTREIFNKAQEESARRKAKAPVSQKSAMTASGKYSKYALTEVMICGECGSRYKRVTWNIRGKRRIVWRCISRLDYGKKYCTESITVDEQALQRAIVRALNRFNVEDEATYLLLMKSTIGEAVGINGSSDEIDLLERRIDALNKRMLDLVSLSVQEGDDAENHEDDFKNISTQIEQLTKRITAIRESESENGDFQARLKEIQDIIDKRRENKISMMTPS